MSDYQKTKVQLIQELQQLRQRLAKLETLEAKLDQIERATIPHLEAPLDEKDEALLDGLERLQQVFRAISDQIYVTRYTSDGTFQNIYLSPSFVGLTGYSLDHLLTGSGLWSFGLIYPDDSEKLRLHAGRLSIGQNSELEYRLIRADHSVIWVRDSACVEPEDQAKVIYGVISEITSRRLAQEEIIRLYMAERERYNEAEALRQSALAMVSTIDLSQVIERILTELQSVVPFDTALVQLLEDKHLRVIGGRGISEVLNVADYFIPLQSAPFLQAALQSQISVIVQDIRQQPSLPTYPWTSLAQSSCLFAPLWVSRRVVGLLSLYKHQLNFYTNDHAEKALAYAAQAAIAIDNARLYSEVEHRAQQLAVLHELDRAIASSLQLDDVYQSFAEHTKRLFPFDRMSVVLQESNEFVIVFADGIAEPPVGTRFPVEGSTSGQVIQTQTPLLHRNLEAEASLSRNDLAWATAVRSVMVLPLLARQGTIGTWNIGSRQAYQYTMQDLAIAQAIADQLAIGIVNAQLYQQAQQELVERKHTQNVLEQERASLAQRVAERTAALQAANIRLAQAARLKDEFLANMSHELRTPLHAILGMSEALQEQVYGELNARQLKSLNIIEESGRHLLTLINDILDLAKIGAGELKLELTTVNVSDVCRSSLRLVNQQAKKKRLNVSYSFDKGLVNLQADPRRLKQILVNLLSNAVKFTPEGGSIGLDVSCNLERKQISFNIWDTGIGIATENLHRLFDPFIQLDNRLSREYDGTGLGLSLVFKLVSLHGGTIEVQSKLGEGSRFIVTLPQHQPFLKSNPDEQLISL
ncbi:MAG TPA: ATP-binding protein [Anaerolineae bacterium]|nr:ATP-binding protein [Anaerolineae bacterium]HMR63547.1 ATP-binding protein [Anaerolineae bacterium]